MLIILLLNIVLVTCAVLIHHESLIKLSRILVIFKIQPRKRIVFGVLGVLLAHCLEIWVFALGYYALLPYPEYGFLDGSYTGTFLDGVYFSFTTFTTLGFGDIQPIGLIRYVTGIESLTGFVLVTWSASFLYLEMQANWHPESGLDQTSIRPVDDSQHKSQ